MLFEWSTTASAPSFFTYSVDSEREAVAITLSLSNYFNHKMLWCAHCRILEVDDETDVPTSYPKPPAQGTGKPPNRRKCPRPVPGRS